MSTYPTIGEVSAAKVREGNTEQVICSDGTVLLPGQFRDGTSDNLDLFPS